jgi:hypothetical protein
MMALSFKRLRALVRKEWIQVTRDALTLRFIILVPVLQLFLFGFAINTNPKNLPTGLLSADHSKYERTLTAALQNSGYYEIRTLASEAEAERAGPGRGPLRHRAAGEFRPCGRPRRRSVRPDRRRCQRPLRGRKRRRGIGDDLVVSPLVRRLTNWGLPNGLSVALVIVLAAASLPDTPASSRVLVNFFRNARPKDPGWLAGLRGFEPRCVEFDPPQLLYGHGQAETVNNIPGIPLLRSSGRFLNWLKSS